jgi:hypothetical protein
MRLAPITFSLLLSTSSCATILASKTATVTPPPGALLNGAPGPQVVSKKASALVQYPDGRTCVVGSQVSAGYVIADIVFTFLIGLVVDGVTENWKTLDESACPGVLVD